MSPTTATVAQGATVQLAAEPKDGAGDPALEADDSHWRICSWHKNQEAMQVDGKTNSVGWVAYETCLEQGAIIAERPTASAARAGGPRRDRTWDVRITNPDGTSVVLPGGADRRGRPVRR